MRKFSLLLILFFISYYVKAKDTLQINNWSITKPFLLKQPYINDSVNVLGIKFDDVYLLKNIKEQNDINTDVSFPEIDSTGSIKLNQFNNQSAALYFLSFNIKTDVYIKPNLILTTPHMIEVYLNDLKIGEKVTLQKSEKEARSLDISLKLAPQSHNIRIKYLYPANDSIPLTIKGNLISDFDNFNDYVSFESITAKRPIILKDILVGERPISTSVSPDGKYILSVSSISLGKNKYKYLYKIFDYKTSKLILSSEDKGWNWMPNGSRLYYSINTNKGKNLRIMDLSTMQETTVVESLPDGFFKWAPNEKYLLFTLTDKYPDNKTGVNHIVTPRDRQKGYRNRYFLAYYDLSNKLLQPITFGKYSTDLIDISPDSKHILFSSSKENYTEIPFVFNSFYMLNVETMKVDTLWNDTGYGTVLCFSPNGKQLLLSGGPDSFNGIGRDKNIKEISNNYDKQAFIYDLQSKQIKPITKNFAPSIKSAKWSKADNNIYFIVDDEDYVNCYRYFTKNDTFEKLLLPSDIVFQFDIANDNLAAAYIGQTASYPSQLYKVDIKLGKTDILYNPMKQHMSRIELGEVNNWDFISRNGDDIKGRYYLPYNFDPNKKYPLIVYYYGGTTPVNRMFDSRYPFHLYASMGYIVYVLQPSGTIGFGQTFSSYHVNAWGQRTAEDIIEGTQKFSNAHKFVDNSKIGCIGASYGGFMTMYLQTRTDIFAAAVSHAGISDITSYWGEGYWGYAYNTVAAYGSYPWNNQNLFIDQSPLFSADKIKTPILLLHGAADTNVPVGESVQMFTALKLLGKNVELITFDGEDHFIIDFEKRTYWQNNIFAWFARWLQNNDTWWNDLHTEKNL